MKTRWKRWVAGIVLVQLLVIGVDLALLWPTPNDAERVAAKIEVGMTWDRARELMQPRLSVWQSPSTVAKDAPCRWSYEDGSGLIITRDPTCQHVIEIDTTPPTLPPATVHPLTRLRRTIARVLPFVGE
jgi:hypothetical protein